MRCEMNCIYCGQGNVDGAMSAGSFVCVDCWADGTARMDGREAEQYAPPSTPYSVIYPLGGQEAFLKACNKR